MVAAEKNIMRPRMAFDKREPKEFEERVIEIARVSRVVKGGRRIRFRALVVVGDKKGRIGMGVAKANEVAVAVKKAVTLAKKNLVTVSIINGTIPHEVNIKHGGAKVMLKPATSGTSVVAGGSIRIVAELAGITDLLAKSLGSSNKINNVTAAIKALCSFNPEIVEKIKNYSKKDADKKASEAEKPLKPEVVSASPETAKPAIVAKKDMKPKANPAKKDEKAEPSSEIKPGEIEKKPAKKAEKKLRPKK